MSETNGNPWPGACVEVHSGVAIANDEGERAFVEIRWDEKRIYTSPDGARDLAHSLLQAAEASELDSAVIAHLRSTGTPSEEASAFLHALAARRSS